MRLRHGGELQAAALRFDVPLQQWTDLSTGISPYSWPAPEVPVQVWRDLPDDNDGLEQAAAVYYGCAEESLLAVPGSQYALATVPALLQRGSVALPQRGYAEHRQAWLAAGHSPVTYADGDALRALVQSGAVNYALVINPNNPSAEVFSREELLELRGILQARAGLLVVDEAFADIYPDSSLSGNCPQSGLVVYRSLGKFFGLAGIRLGFLLAQPTLCGRMRDTMMPWQVSHPARWLGRKALADGLWQEQQRQRLQDEAGKWLQQLRLCLPEFQFFGTGLFVTASGAGQRCADLFEFAGRRGLLLRLFEEIDGQRLLRFGLPDVEDKPRVLEILNAFAEEPRCSKAC